MVQVINEQPKPKDNKPLETTELSHDGDKDDNNDEDDEHEISNHGFFFCAFLITLGLLFNKFTYETLQPLTISQPTNNNSWEPPKSPIHLYVNLLIGIFRVSVGILELYLNFVIAIVKPIYVIIPKCEIPSLVSIFVFNLMIILSAMLPKITTDQCKNVGEMMGRGLQKASFASPSVSF